jgi:peptidoglycan/xylan/chitin deacetylase (PgdA/CDA1 family)
LTDECRLGVIVKACTVPGKVALTFDDGPYEHTEKVLDILKDWKVRATFFVSGNNLGKGMIDDPTLPWPALIRRMVGEGHQVGSHGWSHQNMDEISEDQREQQIIYNEMALRNILGLIPKYFRPPYGVCGRNCVAQLKSWGIHAINWNLDTKDIFHNTPETIQTSKDIVKDGILPIEAYDDELRAMYNRSYLVLMHDTQYQTAYTLTDFTIRHAVDQGYELVTVAECLGDTGYWYHDARYEDGASECLFTERKLKFPQLN